MRRTLARLTLLHIALALAACSTTASPTTDALTGYPAYAAQGIVNVIVEIPAGSNDKWMVDKASGELVWEHENGRPRVVQYLAYPGNYGMIPQTALPKSRGGDGDPLDVLLLGPAVARGAVIAARPIGVLRLLDDGERDDKILAVGVSGPLSDATGLDTLATKYPGTLAIVETWFTHYKGPGRAVSGGFGDAAEATAIIREASRYFDAEHRGP